MDVYNRREIKENYLATCESQNGIFWFEITIIYDDIVISGRVYIAENNLNYMHTQEYKSKRTRLFRIQLNSEDKY